MRVKCGLSKYERMTNWHRWFAWRPVKVAEGDCRWLEWVERKQEMCGAWGAADWRSYYRALKEKE